MLELRSVVKYSPSVCGRQINRNSCEKVTAFAKMATITVVFVIMITMTPILTIFIIIIFVINVILLMVLATR